MNDRDRIDILLVDDQPAKLLSYETILRELDENLIRANSGAEALQVLLKREVAVVLTDVCMPDLDGFELARMLREHPRYEKTAIIFVSAIQVSDQDRIEGYATGAVDYVPVPVIPEILRAKVKIFVELYRKSRELHSLNLELERRVLERTSELERSADLLRESEERMRLASEAAGFGTYDYNPASGSIYWSPSLRRIVGAPEDEPLTVDTAVRFIHPDDRPIVLEQMQGRVDDDERRELEFRIVRPDGEIRWCLARGQMVKAGHDSDVTPRVMGTMIDITERKAAEDRQRLLMAELDHRVKNVLSNVSAIAHLSSRNSTSVGDYVSALDGRIQAMSRAHDSLRRASWQATDFRDIAQEILAPFRSSGDRNLQWDESELWVKPEVVQSLALVLHELATNAVKYGALSNGKGNVRLSWSEVVKEGRKAVQLVWREAGGPDVETPSHKGFGFTFLDSAARGNNAVAEYSFAKEGLTYSLTGSFEGSRPERRVPPRAQQQRPARTGEARARRVLIVEDEWLVAMQLQRDLEESGHHVIGPALTLADGLSLAEAEIDAALIDVSLGRDTSAPIAERLMQRSIPFAFATGYSDSAILPQHLRNVPRLSKPYLSNQVTDMLSILMNQASAARS
jgi:PAS domain S-box-containing protein